MANMSYCRFENTLRDLRDCYEHIDEAISESEIKARKSLLALCWTMLQEGYEHLPEDDRKDYLNMISQ